MIKRRRRIKQVHTLEERLAARAAEFRKEAEDLPPGGPREQALFRARQAEDGAQMSQWLRPASKSDAK
jgi:hypothetical protein